MANDILMTVLCPLFDDRDQEGSGIIKWWTWIKRVAPVAADYLSAGLEVVLVGASSLSTGLGWATSSLWVGQGGQGEGSGRKEGREKKQNEVSGLWLWLWLCGCNVLEASENMKICDFVPDRYFNVLKTGARDSESSMTVR